MKTIASSLILASALLFAGSAFAQSQTFKVDPGSSQILFSLGDVLHSVHGTFHVQSGSINFDRSSQMISGSVIVAAGSGDSGNQSRDHKMTKDVLDAPKFAEISFAPQSYQGEIAQTGDSAVKVNGVFTLHGEAHHVTVPMRIHIDGSKCTAQTDFTVPYVQWGLKDPSTFLLKVSKEVGIRVMLSGQISSAN